MISPNHLQRHRYRRDRPNPRQQHPAKSGRPRAAKRSSDRERGGRGQRSGSMLGFVLRRAAPRLSAMPRATSRAVCSPPSSSSSDDSGAEEVGQPVLGINYKKVSAARGAVAVASESFSSGDNGRALPGTILKSVARSSPSRRRSSFFFFLTLVVTFPLPSSLRAARTRRSGRTPSTRTGFGECWTRSPRCRSWTGSWVPCWASRSTELRTSGSS